MDDSSDVDDSMDGLPASSGMKGDDDARKHARAQHNALERRRRDNIKAMYGCLEGKVAKGGEKLSRAAILKSEKQARIAELRELNQRLCKETEILRARKKEAESTQLEDDTTSIQQRINGEAE
ncbi:unnamed protein product, partial [Mesorhabditis belari]|uniref:BHLH domain-containing protein n=1 Tax=Mesorhabditis belari TaxID=2138241 RepID=A0AAF3F5D4_9BILA